MPQSRGARLRQRVQSCRNDSDRALSRILEMKYVFSIDHPEYIPLLDALGEFQLMFQVSLGDFFEHAWGRRPPEFPSLPQVEPEE